MYLLLLRTLCSVLGAALLTVCNTLSIKRTANDVVTYTGEVTNSSASDKNYRVLLKVVSDSGNVGGCLKSVCKSYSGDLTERGVRLLRAGCGYLCAYASLLRCGGVSCFVGQCVKTYLKYRSLRLVGFVLTTLSYELVKGCILPDYPPSFSNLMFILQTHKRVDAYLPVFKSAKYPHTEFWLGFGRKSPM